MQENLIQNEYDVFTEINNNTEYFKNILETMPNLKLNKYDRTFLINSYKNTTNNIINYALLTKEKFDFFNERNLKNKILPDNYIKPSNLQLLQNINKLDEDNTLKVKAYVQQLLENQNVNNRKWLKQRIYKKEF